MPLLLLLLLILLAPPLLLCRANPVIGICSNDAFDEADINCTLTKGIGVAMFWSGFLNSGVVDQIGIANLARAVGMGIRATTVYMDPCPTGDPAKQVEQLCTYLHSEIPEWRFRVVINLMRKDGWTANRTQNRAFVVSLTKALNADRRCFGVLYRTSQVDYNELFGADFLGLSGEILAIYVEHDGNSRLRNFKAFGGWIRPLFKEFVADTEQYCDKVISLIASAIESAVDDTEELLAQPNV